MPQPIKACLPLAALVGSLASLGFVGLAIEPGSIALLALGGAMIAARKPIF